VSFQYLYLVTCHLPEWDGTKNSEKNAIASAQLFSGPEKQKKSGPPTLSVKNFTFSFNLNTADGATTFSITILSIMTLRITIKNATFYIMALELLSVIYAECRKQAIMRSALMPNAIMLNVIMLNGIMLNVVMLNDIMLNVIMLNVVMLSVVAPCIGLGPGANVIKLFGFSIYECS
jgi:hypothetical protein